VTKPETSIPDNPLVDDSIAETLLSGIPEDFDDAASAVVAEVPPRPRRNFAHMMRRISVTLTLEVGAARISLLELTALGSNSVLELDTLAGEPLVMKVNGTPIGRAEVVVTGDNYGLKVLEIDDLDLDSLA
jgi:flagellar motor switch protein FliN/FliY